MKRMLLLSCFLVGCGGGYEAKPTQVARPQAEATKAPVRLLVGAGMDSTLSCLATESETSIEPSALLIDGNTWRCYLDTNASLWTKPRGLFVSRDARGDYHVEISDTKLRFATRYIASPTHLIPVATLKVARG